MATETQISAIISESTRERLERHARATGVKKGHLVEQALLHHLQALEELPVEYVVHPRLVLTQQSLEKVIAESRSGRPTAALRRLMRRGD